MQTICVTSRGLWSQRQDLQTVLNASIRPQWQPGSIDAYAGWGNRPSGQKARSLGQARAKPVLLLEDGFLKSYAPGKADPAHSFVVDRSGIYFDMRGASDLRSLIDQPLIDTAKLDRAQKIIDRLKFHQVSKYNNAPQIGLDAAGLPSGRPFVLLVDQVAGDASIPGALASDQSFEAMLLDARSRYPDHDLVVRTHPAAGDRSLVGQAAKRHSIPIIVPGRMNPWPLLNAAKAVYTVSSQLGLEALMAGCKVHCFGATYYSHRGLTEDHVQIGEAKRSASLTEIVHRAYIDYSVYLDVHDRTIVPVETAIDQILTVRDHRNRIARQVYTGGLSPWKRKAITPFTTGPMGPPVHCRNLENAVTRARQNSGMVALWGSGQSLPEGVPGVRFEDGFIRSRGLGALLALPCSLAMDGQYPYYDARGPSHLETILKDAHFSDDLLARSKALIAKIVALGVSKYNVGSVADLPVIPDGRMKILVPGQVEKDASIRLGSPIVRSNAALVAAVRLLFPDAFIAYKEHPDVTSGMRSGGQTPQDADLIVRSGSINDWIFWADRIETMTSLTGFEALLRARPVGVHGMPFYAGWGLTDDRMAITRRGRPLSLEQLAAGALILYPCYIHPVSGMPCTPEILIDEIAAKRPDNRSIVAKLAGRIAQTLNRAAVKFRDARL